MNLYVRYVSRSSIFSRLDVRVKLFLIFIVSTLILVWENLFYTGGLLLVVVVLMLLSHIEVRYIWNLLRVMIPFMAIVLAIHGLWNQVGKTAIASLPEWIPLVGGRLTLYSEGLAYGLMVCCRLLAALFVLPLVVMTTEVNDLMVGLVRMRVPYKVAFLFSVVLRFVPLIFTEINAIREAQRLRGLAIEKMNLARRVTLFASLGVPLILGTLLKAQTLQIALESKAFSGSPNRTFLNEIRMRPADYAVLALGLIAFIGAVVTRFAFGWGKFGS